MRKINKEHIVSIESEDQSLYLEYFHVPFKKGGLFRKNIEEGLYFKERHWYTGRLENHKINLDKYKNERYIIENNKIYNAPFVRIKLLEGRDHYLYFKTFVGANLYFQRFKHDNLVQVEDNE